MIGGTALDGGGHDLPCPLVRLLLGPLLDLLDLDGCLMGDLGLHLGDEIGLGLVGGEAGDPLQHLSLAALDGGDLLQLAVHIRMLGGQRLLFLLDVFVLSVQVLFLLLKASFLLLNLVPALLYFLLILASAA